MSNAEHIIEVCKSLREEKQAELVDFALFLLARQDDEAWERIIADQTPKPRLEAFLRASGQEGDEPMDSKRL